MSSLLRLANTSIRAFAVLALALSACAQQNKEPVDHVNPNIGGIGQLLSATSPNVIMRLSNRFFALSRAIRCLADQCPTKAGQVTHSEQSVGMRRASNLRVGTQ